MRIAVASEGLDVSSHFSCCTNFNYYKIENGEMVDSRNLPSQGHLCGSQANFLRQIDVKILICGSISKKETETMENAGIKVIPGASGRAFQVVADYLKNNPATVTAFSQHSQKHSNPYSKSNSNSFLNVFSVASLISQFRKRLVATPSPETRVLEKVPS